MAGIFDYSELTGEKKEKKEKGESFIKKSKDALKGSITKVKDHVKEEYKDVTPMPDKPKEEPKPEIKKGKIKYKKTGLLIKSNPFMKLVWMIKKDFKLLIRSKTLPTSFIANAAVGSSIITTLALKAVDLAIATACL